MCDNGEAVLLFRYAIIVARIRQHVPRVDQRRHEVLVDVYHHLVLAGEAVDPRVGITAGGAGSGKRSGFEPRRVDQEGGQSSGRLRQTKQKPATRDW